MKKGIILAAGLCTALMADSLGTAPGTKARAMGGAFTAVANNNSAIYFNPAGLIVWEEGQEEFNAFTAEIGTALSLDSEDYVNNGDEYADDYNNYFWGVSHFGKDVGFGVGSYSLYSARNPYPTSGYIEQENKILALAGAFKLTDSLYPGGGKISIGGTIGYAWTYNFWDSEVDPDQADAESGIWSLALKARLYESNEFNVDFGVNYRAETDYDTTALATVEVVPWNIPEETAFGLAVSVPTEFANITVAYDYKDIGYQSATEAEPGKENTSLFGQGDVTSHCLGAELAFEQLQVRAGYYKDSADESTDLAVRNTMEGEGYTAGVGFTFDQWNLEAAVEKREITAINFDDDSSDNTYYSVSANYVF